MTIARCSLLLVALAAALSIAACAEAPPPMVAAAPPPVVTPESMRSMQLEPMPPPPPPAPSMGGFSPNAPKTIDGEMLAIGEADAQIERMFPGVREEDKDTKKKGTAPRKGDAPAAPMATGDSCGVACRALASMQRSANHLCSLSGERDGRCDDARARVRGATSRVKASCPACPAP